jgi:circadian clock protein KaiB
MAPREPAPSSTTDDFERLAAELNTSTYIFKLYVSGMTPRSTEAINNLKAICDEHLQGRYQLEIIDVYKHPEETIADQIVATPTLVKQLPLPIRRIVGTLSDPERVLTALKVTER